MRRSRSLSEASLARLAREPESLSTVWLIQPRPGSAGARVVNHSGCIAQRLTHGQRPPTHPEPSADKPRPISAASRCGGGRVPDSISGLRLAFVGRCPRPRRSCTAPGVAPSFVRSCRAYSERIASVWVRAVSDSARSRRMLRDTRDPTDSGAGLDREVGWRRSEGSARRTNGLPRGRCGLPRAVVDEPRPAHADIAESHRDLVTWDHPSGQTFAMSSVRWIPSAVSAPSGTITIQA
jgi:hypothetical protein